MLTGVQFRAFALKEFTARGIRFLTLRQRGRTELARLVALTVAAWREVVTPAKDLDAGYATATSPSPGGTATTCAFAPTR